MNSKPNIIPVVLIALAAWWFWPQSSGDNAGREAAKNAVQQYAKELNQLAAQAMMMEPDKAAAFLKTRCIPAYDAAWKPLNEVIDQSIKDGNFSETMLGVSQGFADASK